MANKKFSEKLKEYRHNPILFCREVVKFEPDGWQVDVLTDISKSEKVTVRSGQGVGKTSVEAVVALWFLTCFPFSRIVATAPTRQQLNDILWSEMAKWINKSPILNEVVGWTKTYVYLKGYEKRWFAVARTATTAENMQGFHEDNMLFIVDEASGVADDIMEAILGTLSGENNKLLMCGNPTRTTGAFYDSHTADRHMYKVHRVSSADSGRTNKDNIAALIRKYGAESNVVRVRVYGEFPEQEDDVFIPISDVEASVYKELFLTDKKESDFIPSEIHLGVDVARYGDDETVIITKTDQWMHTPYIRHGQNLMATVGDVVRISNKLHETYTEVQNIVIKIDDTGLGGGVTDRLRELKVENSWDWMIIAPINFAQSVPRGVKDHLYYSDIVTYMWACLRDLLKEKALKLPNDSDLVGQLTTRKYMVQSNGKIQVESKKAMKERGLKSPDRADAAVLACMPIKVNRRNDEAKE
ncbi:DEAD/DEAH box helicase family protein [Eubacterium sp.]|uniref:DEAD/DEAH box helicase family protein n=1 Tax=Eubacterium sp. TaxID=142586 RepID=UPI002FC5A4FC